MNTTTATRLTTALLGCTLLLGPLARAQTPAPAAPSAPAAAPANTPYGIGAQRNGVVKCVGRINQVSGFLAGNNANSGMMLTAGPKDANQRIAATMMEIEGAGVTSFISSSFAPGAGNNECSGTYDAITYWNAPCNQVASSNFSTFAVTRPLLRTVTTLDGGPFIKVFLMPAGTGCVSVKKEMLF